MKGCGVVSKIGDNIKKRREELNLSQEELAIKMNYKHRSSINKIELGINKFPMYRLEDFAVALQTTVEKLLGYDVNELKSGALYGDIKAVLIDNLRVGKPQDPEFVQHAKKFTCEIVEIVFGKSASKLLDRFDYLNDKGKDKLIERLNELENLNQYKGG